MSTLDLVTRTQAKRTKWDEYRNLYSIPVKTVSDVASVINDLNAGRLLKFVEFYNYMLDRDLDIASVLSSRIDRVISTTYKVEPASNDPDDIAAANFCGDVCSKMPRFYDHIRAIAEAISLGFSACELEWKYRDGNVVVSSMDYVHPRRFIYTPQWELRLYDYGMAGTWGQALWPMKWIVHTSAERQGDPCMYGLVRALAYPFLFRHYTQKFWLHYSEVYGQPHILVHVDQNTPDDVVEAIRTELEHWSYDHISVVKGETKPEITAQGTSKESADGFRMYLDWSKQAITRFVLGSSDINEAGSVGSLASTQQRADSMVDPKRDRDGMGIATTLQDQLFRPLLSLNGHLFSKRPGVPRFSFVYPEPPKPEPAMPPPQLAGRGTAPLSKKAPWA